MKLSPPLSGLFTASFLWCQGFSLTVETSTNAGNSSEGLAGVESYSRPIKDVSSGTVKDSMDEYDISTVQKSRSLQTMMHHWVQRGNTVLVSADDSSSANLGEFGASVALSRNGKLLVVGAPEQAGGPCDDSVCDGKIEIYKLRDSEWDLLQTITGSSGTAEGGKGQYVSITPNGKHIAVRNRGASLIGETVSVYEKNEEDGMYTPIGNTIIACEMNDFYSYGYSRSGGVDISEDGKKVVFGCPDMDMTRGGAAFVYQFVDFLWQKIWEEGPPSTVTEMFGSDVTMSNDGKSFAILTKNPATVDVWVEDASDLWTSYSLDLSDLAIPSTSMTRVAMSGDGMHIVLAVTDPYGADDPGYALVFDKVGLGLDEWELDVNSPLKPSSNFDCGADVAITYDGTKFIMACPGSSFEGGSAIVYEKDESGAWSQVGQVISKQESTLQSVAIADKAGGNNAGTNVAVGSKAVNTVEHIGSAAVYNLLSVPCVDSPAEMRMETMGGGDDKIPFFCKWVDKGQGSTCGEYGFLNKHCPSSCGSCAMYGCSDSDAKFVVDGGGETYCASLALGDQTLIGLLCENNRIRKSCRQTCGYCLIPIEV